MEIIAGLHQLKVPIPNNPIGYVLPYLFEVPGGCAIIDPGWNADESEEALRSQMQALGLGFGDVKQIIVTHVHPDHFGLAGKVREASGAPIYVHERDIEQIRWRAGRSSDEIETWFRNYGLPEGETPVWQAARNRRWQVETEPDQLMKDGESLRLGQFELQVIWTPGHSAGHACFYMASEELLLSGDHVLPTISPNVSLWPGSEDDNPLADYLHSLNRLRGLRTRRVLPAHEYDFEDLEGRLDSLEEHHEDRLQQMVDSVQAGATTAYEIARAVRWSIGHFDNFDPGTQRAAVTETVAHVRYLIGEGRLRTFQQEDGISRVALPS
ncbi:MAG TPA: MBL fold metallo-hydrolase [Dehalococcoidia bacterium]|nr:MBL fold metallo-hydrolase [Dehalococcoidia bacterium]